MLFKPFDFNPINSGSVNDTYTVPAGKYAIVTVQVWARAMAALPSLAAAYTNGFVNGMDKWRMNNDFQTITQEFKLRPADVITKTAADASGNLTYISNANINEFKSENATTSVSALLNGIAMLQVKATANAQIMLDHNGAFADTILANFTGEHGVHITYAEYIIPT